MAFRSTEITVREALLEELQQRGVRVGHELSVPLPYGRKEPDAVLTNGGNYILETKMGGEAAHYKDVLKLSEWLKLRHLPIRGAFAILIPAGLREFPWDPETAGELARDPRRTWEVTAIFRDDRPGDHKAGPLAEIADWVAKQVLRAEVVVAPDVSFILKLLSGTVADLNARMKHLGMEELQDIFGGRSVFDNILELEEGQYPVKEMRSATSYLLINQLLFYNVLSRVDPSAYPPIETEALEKP